MKGFVYIMTNNNNSVLYTGVTSNLKNRVLQHQLKIYSKSFSSRYNTRKLVYYECYETIGEAIKREKQIKAGPRKTKLKLISGMNPEWKDISNTLDARLGLLRPPVNLHPGSCRTSNDS
jgi:putative endonuclease